MSIALPAIMKEFGYSRTDVGIIVSALFITYGIGQFINGQLGDKFGARKLIFIGIIFSAILNIAFGFTISLISMAIIWGANGYFQSMGWAPSIKTLANWFPIRKRGRISGLYGSGFQIGNMISWLLAGYLCFHYGWRYVFWVPAYLSLFVGVYFYIRCRNSPEDIGLPSIEEYEKRSELLSKDGVKKWPKNKDNGIHNRDNHLGFSFTLKKTIGNPRIWCVGLSYLFLGFVSFGFLYWLPTYMFEVQGITISKVASKAIILPLAGALGALTAGWATDRFFKSRRAPIIVLMSFLTGVFLLLYLRIPIGSSLLSLFCLGMIGFTTFGAQTIMATAIPMDYGTRKAASSAAGFIDGLGYLGAAFTGVGTGWLVDNYGWNYAFYFWAAGAFISCIIMLSLWRYTPTKSKYV